MLSQAFSVVRTHRSILYYYSERSISLLEVHMSKQYVPRPISILEDDDFSLEPFHQLDRNNKRSGACEDDYERSAPYVGIFPDESEHEDGSPIRF